MNVVMLSPYYAPHLGGVERHVEHIAQECEKDGHHITIFTHSHDKTLPPKETHGSITILRNVFASPLLIQFSTLLSHFLSKSTVSKLIERMEIWSWLLLHIPTFLVADVIHIHDVFFWYWPLRFLLFWKHVYITFHGFEAGSLPTTKAIHARSLAEKWTWGNICDLSLW
jgi:glycosyltransferase involved in cell wall biosynthesis